MLCTTKLCTTFLISRNLLCCVKMKVALEIKLKVNSTNLVQFDTKVVRRLKRNVCETFFSQKKRNILVNFVSFSSNLVNICLVKFSETFR